MGPPYQELYRTPDGSHWIRLVPNGRSLGPIAFILTPMVPSACPFIFERIRCFVNFPFLLSTLPAFWHKTTRRLLSAPTNEVDDQIDVILREDLAWQQRLWNPFPGNLWEP